MRGIRRRVVFVVLAVLLAGMGAGAAQACDAGVELLITEFMALNTKTLLDEDGDYSDWIEIYDPCLPDVDLDGWYLTDDPANLAKWRFPSVHLARGEMLVVFASGKNRAVAGSQLHASFKLAVEGEYLALVKPDGTTIAQEFAPQFPPQHADYSYGLPQAASSLVQKGASASYHTPTSEDAALGAGWTATGFDDSSWSVGPTGLGFTTGGAAGFEVTYYKANIAVNDLAAALAVIADPALQSSVATETAPSINYLNTSSGAHFGDDRPFPSTVIGVDVNDFVIEATATILIPRAGPWTFGVNSDDGFSFELSREPHYFTFSYPNPRGPADSFAVFDIPEAGAYTVYLVMYERGGGSEVELFAAEGSFTSFSSAFHLIGDGASGGLRFSEIASLLGTDVSASVRNVNTSFWARVPFSVADPNALDLLTMRVAYEDGFVAHLNGAEVASRNAPAPVQWDSASATDRPLDEAGVFDTIDLSDRLGLLLAGSNVLAVHGLNDSVGDGDFLVLPELSAVEDTAAAGPRVYFEAASPGTFNSSGYAGVSGSPVFSHPSAIFTDPFSLAVTAAPGAVIRYTLNGTDPSETNGIVYSSPLAVDNSTRVRARVFEPGLAPGPVVTRMYVMLGADVVSANSNLPLVVVDTFGGAVNTTWFIETLVGLIPTTGGRAAITATPEFVGPAGLRLRGSSSLQFPKKSFNLETWDEHRDDLQVSLLGMPAQSDWILYAPYTDKSLMRDVLAYKWSNDIGRYAPRTHFVEVYLRTSTGPVVASDYVGVYVLEEKIKRDPGRVNITELLPDDAAPPAVTGGYITKKDRLDPGDSGFLTSRGQRLCYVEPKEEEITTTQAAYLKGYYDEFETVLYGAGFADPVNGYAKYIDADSWIDHHWLVEAVKNIDGFRLSTFMFKDRSAKLNMGPLWDYNLTLGNANYLDGWLTSGWYHDKIGGGDYPWWPRLFADPEWVVRYWDRWWALRRTAFRTDRLIADIDSYAQLLDESQARNYQRWPILGIYVWPNWFIGATYQEEVDWMKQWLEGRLAWIDGQAFAPPAFNHDGGLVPAFFELTMSAPRGVIYYTLDGTDPRLPGGGLAAGAVAYTGPVVIAATTQVKARALDGAEWSAVNEGTFEPRPLSYVNEVLPDNATVRADELGDFDPWIEFYNPFTSTVDLGGLTLTDELTAPAKWTFPANTLVCGQQWLVLWADNEPAEGPLHASFRLNPAGGTVWLFDTQGRLLNSVAYPALGRNVSYGRSPDGGDNLLQFQYATPGAANSSATTRLLVNEYNAVATDRLLAGVGVDTYWGRVLGNGGDWFELVVIEDHLDLRGWQVAVKDNSGPTNTTLVFTDAALLADLRSGTIITVAENLVSDASYDPANGDWWINLRSGGAGDGVYISALDFNTSQQNTQLTVRDASGAVAFGPAGEGVNPLSGVGADEVFKLEQDPGPSVTAFSSYNDGTSSTFGAANLWSGGAGVQDFSVLRSVVSASCTVDSQCDDANPCTDDACVGERCQNTPNAAPCDDGNVCTDSDACAERQCRGQVVATCCFSDCDCNDGQACTTDTCTGAACFHGPASGPACDDGLWCTVSDTCSLGACVGAARDCGDGDLCTDDSCAGTECLNTVNGACSVAGAVRYYRDVATAAEPSVTPAPGVGVDRTQDGAPDAVTDGAGEYAFGGLYGAVTIQTLGKWGSPRAADHNNAISSLDAVFIARHAVGLSTLSPNQQIAGDVSGNGEVTSFDAARVSRFAVELLDHFDVAQVAGSDWKTLRCDHYTDATHHDCTTPVYTHSSLPGAVTDDFYALLYGDVSGNWRPAGGFAAASSPEEQAAALEDRREAERLSQAGVSAALFPAASRGAVLTLSGWRPSAPVGAAQDLLLSVTNGDGIEALDFVIVHDPSQVEIVSVSPVGLGAPFKLATNVRSGACRIGMYTVIPIRGSGSLLTITVRTVAAPAPKLPLSLDGKANEGRIPLSFRIAR